MFKKIPFGDTLLDDLGILQPEKAFSYQVATVLRLANRFPQLELATSQSLNCLKEEFSDFLLSPAELKPLITTYKAWEPNFSSYWNAINVDKPRAGNFWCKVGQLKCLDGELRFPLFFKLMAGLLSIPCSNADSAHWPKKGAHWPKS